MNIFLWKLHCDCKKWFLRVVTPASSFKIAYYDISALEYAYALKIRLWWPFLMVNKIIKKFFKISKISNNLGIKSEFCHFSLALTLKETEVMQKFGTWPILNDWPLIRSHRLFPWCSNRVMDFEISILARKMNVSVVIFWITVVLFLSNGRPWIPALSLDIFGLTVHCNPHPRTV